MAPQRLLPTRRGSVVSGRFLDIDVKNRYLKTRSALLISGDVTQFGMVYSKQATTKKLGSFL